MQLDQFPHEYELKRRKRVESDIRAEQSRTASRVKTIEIRKGTPADIANWAGGWALTGFVVGFFACCGQCGKDVEISTVFITWIAITVLGALLGAALARIMNAQQRSINEVASAKAEEERLRCEKTADELRAQAERDIAAYKNEFEAEAQRMSAQYIQNSFVAKVIDHYTELLASKIEAVYRSDDRSMVEAELCFEVYSNGIAVEGTASFDFRGKDNYWFTKERLEELRRPLEQAAVAHAIANAIPGNYVRKYPKVVTDRNIRLNVSYTYRGYYLLTGIDDVKNQQEHVCECITYTATNGNYRPVQS